jgi:hypothetical protein
VFIEGKRVFSLVTVQCESLEKEDWGLTVMLPCLGRGPVMVIVLPDTLAGLGSMGNWEGIVARVISSKRNFVLVYC